MYEFPFKPYVIIVTEMFSERAVPIEGVPNMLRDTIEISSPAPKDKLDTDGKIVYSVALEILVKEARPLDLTSTATPQRYRLLNCRKFTEHKILQIEEFSTFPSFPYSAISYVWRGNPVHGQHRSFGVQGAEDADPITIEVLEDACAASLQLGPEFIWLDRLCIMQTSREDKSWQISRMNQVYSSCAQCIILPGGLGRLMYLHEETAWIHRAWTLQEALAPANAMVLFAWKMGSGECMSGDEYGTVREVVPNHSALSHLSTLVNACATGELSLTRPTYNTAVPARIFGSESPNLTALGVTMSTALLVDPDTKNHAIWQCALMRTSSRPVDMVFSIMGLFGVSLDPRAFHKNDRLGATVALARQILENGGRASWLGASYRLQPCKQLSTFPEFPRPSVAGKALIKTASGLRETADMMDSEYPNDYAMGMSMPEGTMDDIGYLTFNRKSARVFLAANQELDVGKDVGDKLASMRAVDGTTWNFEETSAGLEVAQTYAVLLGWFQKYYPGATLASGVKIRIIILEEHKPGRYHVKTFSSLDRHCKDLVLAWTERAFSVGGPDALDLTQDPNVESPTDDVTHTKQMAEAEAHTNGDRGSFRFAEYFYLTEGEPT